MSHFLSEDPSRALFLRPSLNFFLTRLWITNRDRFWKMLWHLYKNVKHRELFLELADNQVKELEKMWIA